MNKTFVMSIHFENCVNRHAVRKAKEREMATVKMIHIDRPEAQQLADLYGIRSDLQGAQRYCEYAIKLSEQGVPSILKTYELVGAVVAAAIVRYMRPFGSGRRYSLDPKDVFRGLDDMHREFHDFIKKLRDLHIAHPVNEYEQSYVTAAAREDNGVKDPISGVAAGQKETIFAGVTAGDLRQLIEVVNAVVEGRIKDEEAKVIEFLQSLPVEEVHASSMYTINFPRPVENHRRRHTNK